MSLRALASLLTRRFSPYRISRAQAVCSSSIVSKAGPVSVAGRPSRALRTIVSPHSYPISIENFLPRCSDRNSLYPFLLIRKQRDLEFWSLGGGAADDSCKYEFGFIFLFISFHAQPGHESSLLTAASNVTYKETDVVVGIHRR